MASSEYAMKSDEDKDSVLNKQFDTRTFLENLGNILKGFAYDAEQKKYVSIQDNGFLNATGAKQVLNEIEGRIQNINASANLRRQEIADIREEVWFALCKKLYVNSKEYGLSPVNVRPILNLVDHNLLAFLSRAEGASFFNRLSNFFQRKETISQSYQVEAPQKKRLSF